MSRLSLLLATILFSITAYCQLKDTAGSLPVKLPPKYLSGLEKQSSQLEKKVEEKSVKALKAFSKQEQKLYRRLYKIDSVAAKELFSQSQAKINQLQEKLKKATTVTSSTVSQYIPHLDSVKTSLKFLSQLQGKIPGGDKLQSALAKVQGLDSKLQSASEIRNYLKQRKEQLKAVVGKYGFAKELRKLNKQVYYYQAQMNEYKQMLKDPKKMEKKAMAMLTKLPAFQQFMKKNSMLASLFRMPEDGADMQASLAGLQTRADMQTLIQSRFAGTGVSPQQYIQQQVGVAQAEISKLKNKVAQFGGGSSDEEVPDFKPNNQKSKSFLKRLEFGSNFQTSKNNQYFPVTTDIGLSLGYKLNDKSIIGIGTSYKLGLGTGFNNIKFTGEGMGLRSFIDWKLKGSFYVSGGYEFNYRNSIKSITQLKDYTQWQKSGLLGLSKIVSMNSKFFKKTKVQLLYDFLWREQRPVGQQVNFRVGYNF